MTQPIDQAELATRADRALLQHDHADHAVSPEIVAEIPQEWLIVYRRPPLPFGTNPASGPPQYFLNEAGKSAFFQAHVRAHHQRQAEAAAIEAAQAEVEEREAAMAAELEAAAEQSK